jgi:3-hydroxyisobutyrate dehydrogenase-like beta-hydroxyacid dehydrogenase
MATTIGIVNPGEMGAAVGASLAGEGHEVLWASEGRSGATEARATAAGLTDTGSLGALIERSNVIFSVCPPHAAVDVARQLVGFQGLFLDANAIAPATALEVRSVIEKGGASYVDGGIIGSPPGGRERTRLYLSGERANEVAALFGPAQVLVKVVSASPTAASAVKMGYAAWTKGTAALLLDIVALARAEGVEADLTAEWSETSTELIGRSWRAAQSAATKGWRWVGEMEEIAASFRAVGLPPGFHEASAEIYRRSPHEVSAPANEETLDTVIDALGGRAGSPAD